MQRKNAFAVLGVFYVALILIAFSFVLLLIIWLCIKRAVCCGKLLVKIRAKLIMTAPIQYVITGYFRLVGMTISLLFVGIYAKEKSIPTLIGLACVVLFLFLWPLLTICFLLRNIDRLEE